MALTTADIPVSQVTDAAKVACEQLLILGQESDGTLYAASSIGDAALLLFWLETFKHKLLAGDFTSVEI